KPVRTEGRPLLFRACRIPPGHAAGYRPVGRNACVGWDLSHRCPDKSSRSRYFGLKVAPSMSHWLRCCWRRRVITTTSSVVSFLVTVCSKTHFRSAWTFAVPTLVSNETKVGSPNLHSTDLYLLRFSWIASASIFTFG